MRLLLCIFCIMVLGGCYSDEEIKENSIQNQQEYEKIQEKLANPEKTIEESIYQQQEN